MDWLAFLADIAKTLIGSLVGAGLAFQYALRRDKAARRLDQKAAGNFALAILARQFSDFQVTKVGIARHRAWVLKQEPNAPVWMQLNPIQIDYSEALRFDIRSLEFLFQRGRGEILEKLIKAEQAYRDFTRLVEVHRTVSDEAQRKVADSGTASDAALETIEATIGPALLAKRRAFTEALFERMERGGNVYLDAARALRRVLIEDFGEDGIISLEPKPDAEIHSIAPAKPAR